MPLCGLGLLLLSLGLGLGLGLGQGLELSKLPSDLLFSREIDLVRLDKEPLKLGRDPLRLGSDPWRHGTDPWRLEFELLGLGLTEFCRLDREPLSRGEDWRRSGGSSSWSLYGPEKTGQDAVEEQEPRSCRAEAVLDLGCRRRVAILTVFLPLARTVFGDPFCTDSSLRPSSEMDTHK